MKEEYFENIEKSRMVFDKLLKTRRAELEYAKIQLAKKGDNALPPDEFAVFAAQMALDMAQKNYETFEARVSRRETLANSENEKQ